MQRLTELETCLNQLTSGNVGIGRQAWATMAGPSDLLRRVLQETVQRIQQEPTAFRALDAALDRCHDSAKEATKYEEDLASAGYDLATMARLLRNMQALIATAGAAVSACSTSADATAAERFYLWAAQAAEHLSGQSLSLDGVIAGTHRIAPGVAFASHAYSQLQALGRPAPTALCWTLYWLRGRRVDTAHSVMLPVAGFQSHSGGWLMDLRLHLLDATGGPLVEHPDLALTLADTSFLSTLQAGWEHGGRQSVCWSLTLRYPTLESLSGLPRLIGDSLGAAAMAGFLLLSQSQFYDQKCIILARVDGENLKGVEHEKEKLDAVCGWNASNASERIVRAVVSAKTALTQSQQQEFQRIGLRVLVQQTVSEVVQVAQVAIRLPASSSTAEQALARLASAPVSLHAEQRHLASGPDALSSMAGMWQMLDQQVGAREQTERRYLRIDDLPFEAVENFTGRSDEINQLVQHLEEGNTCHIRSFIFGMGGVGKTSLALEAVRRVQARNIFPDGIVWHRVQDEDLSKTIDKISRTIFTAARQENIIAGLPTLEDKRQAFQHAFRDYKILFVLDNADYDIDRVLRPLLDLFRNFSVMVTGRRELPWLTQAHVITLGGLSPDEAAELFKKILGNQWQQYGSEANIVEICRRMACLPIAVKLAAFNVRQNRRSLPEYLALWLAGREKLSLLQAETDDLDTSRRNVSTCFDLSLSELSPKERDLFLQMGMFTATNFDFQRLADTLPSDFFADHALPEASQRDEFLRKCLFRLDELSLVERMEGLPFGPTTRIYLHPLLSEFARELSSEQEVASGTRRIHEHCLKDLRENVSVAHTDYELVRNALQWKLNQADHQEFLEYVKAVHNSLQREGFWKLREDMLQMAVNAAQFLDDSIEVAKFQSYLADLLLRKNQEDLRGWALLQQSISTFAETPGLSEEAALSFTFASHRWCGRPKQTLSESLAGIRRGLALSSRVYPASAAHFLSDLASYQKSAGQFQEAEMLGSAIAGYCKSNDQTYNWRLAEHSVVHCLGDAEYYLDALEATIAESLEVFQKNKHTEGLAQIALPSQAELLIYRRDFAAAEDLLAQLQRYAEIMESDNLLAECYQTRTFLEIARGRFVEAMRAALRADQITTFGFPLALAYLHIHADDKDAARIQLCRIARNWGEINSFEYRMRFYGILALYYGRIGNPAAAIASAASFFAYDARKPIKSRHYLAYPSLEEDLNQFCCSAVEVDNAGQRMFGSAASSLQQSTVQVQLGKNNVLSMPKIISAQPITYGEMKAFYAAEGLTLPLYYRLQEEEPRLDEPALFVTGRIARRFADTQGHLLPDIDDIMLIRAELSQAGFTRPTLNPFSLEASTDFAMHWCGLHKEDAELVRLILGSLTFSSEDKYHMLLHLKQHGGNAFPSALVYRLKGTILVPSFAAEQPRFQCFLERSAAACLCLLDPALRLPITGYLGEPSSTSDSDFLMIFSLEDISATAEAAMLTSQPVLLDLGFADCVLVTAQMVDLSLLRDRGVSPDAI